MPNIVTTRQLRAARTLAGLTQSELSTEAGFYPHAPDTTRSAGGSKKRRTTPWTKNVVTTRLKNLRLAPRCGAKTRAGSPCQRPALRGHSRCRLHGGLSPGAPRGSKNGNFKNGGWTAEAINEWKWLRSLVQSFAGNGTER